MACPKMSKNDRWIHRNGSLNGANRLPQTVRQLAEASWKTPSHGLMIFPAMNGLYIYIGYRVQNTILRTVFPSKTILSYSQIVFHESHLITLNHA